MYAKCRIIHKVGELFGNMHYTNIVSWNAMNGGCTIYAIQIL